MSAAILSIGTELTRGEIVNTNASWIADRLSALGLRVSAVEVVGDRADDIIPALRRLTSNNRLLVCTGGLGPTTDDLTAHTVAAAMGVPLHRDPSSEARIQEQLTARGRSLSASNLKQADFPSGARVLRNDWGTAPGFRVEMSTCPAFFLPGVPREMYAMYLRHVEPEAASLVETPVRQIRIRTYGAPESELNDRLQGIEAAYGVELGYRASLPIIEVKALASAADSEQAQRQAQAASQEIRKRLGDIVYAEGGDTLMEAVGQLLRDKGWTLALAESCTGGLLSELFTASSCSDYYLGAVVCYANSVKENILGVSRTTLKQHGAVSEHVAREMASGVRAKLGSDVAASLTGVAGPGGGTADKPVGLVHFAVATGDGIVASSRVFRGERQEIQRRAAFAATDLMRRTLAGLPPRPADAPK